MKILPINVGEAERKHWVVKWLHNAGYYICILTGIAGVVVASRLSSHIVASMSDQTLMGVVRIACSVVGAIVGVYIGFLVGLPLWGMALLLDDIHALRVYVSGFVMVENEKGLPDDEHDDYDDYDKLTDYGTD